MGFDAKVLADSRSPGGHRLTTLEVTFPRFVLAEFNTHRVFSRNSASSRAIPIVKQLRRVLEHPFVPLEFGSNQPGMQAGPALAGEAKEAAEREWLDARDDAVRRVLGLIGEPGAAGGEEMRAAIERSEPAELARDEWHLPLVRPEDREEVDSAEQLVRVSAGRCARVSYLTHAGRRDLSADVELCERLLTSGHMSPLEHPARPLSQEELSEGEWRGNFRGWLQYRKTLQNEDDPLGKGPAPVGVPPVSYTHLRAHETDS